MRKFFRLAAITICIAIYIACLNMSAVSAASRPEAGQKKPTAKKQNPIIRYSFPKTK
ncbi:hypothetical protein [Acetivibrio straminisolvens]|uniref:hypothetical protein n=1 Tax=Acetivibrio straminisolvens TaxID=253314 RepID=UPI001FB0E15B|nr:hypothetical protein [Acetivibrio straminisolvens]